MPTTFATNSNNDLYLDANGNLAVVHDQDAVLQTCARVAKGLLGEMVLDLDRGIPYKQAVWIGTPNLAAFEAALRSAWIEIDGVIEVVSLTLSGVLNYTAVIRTVYGQGSING